ncbi:MAG: formate dehydrogenase subunit delta [Parasphingorhabdus sp.]|uniref:formate dehydrogenase subunit delta n=1 Tax=Parasphingorhabdus sp. TaxID=2709688 RepID=UPI0032664411
MNTLEHLVYMVNQIARNFGTLDQDSAAEATAEHILKYWDPRMKRRIVAHAGEGPTDLSDVATLAVSIVGRRADSSAAVTTSIAS